MRVLHNHPCEIMQHPLFFCPVFCQWHSLSLFDVFTYGWYILSLIHISWVDEATVYARDTQRQMVTDMEEDMLASIESKGVKICYEPDLASLRDATAELYEDPAVTALVPPELTEGVKAAVAEYEAAQGE